MSRSTATGITGAKAHQETAYHHDDKTSCTQERRETKDVFRHYLAVVIDVMRSQLCCQCRINLYGRRVLQPLCGDEGPRCNSQYEKEVPRFFFPVVPEERDPGRQTGSAGMPEIGGDPKGFIAQ